MNNSRYFSTQPSANAVPANQVMAMMPARQGHMVAAGQPMMMQQPMYQQPQQQQMMMQQPMYAPMPMQQQQMMAPVQQQVQAALPNNVQPKLSHAPAQKQFTVTGVDNPHLLEVDAQNLSWQMAKQAANKAYTYSYAPAGQVHDVSVKYNGAHVEGSPFKLMPKEMRQQATMNGRNNAVLKQQAAQAKPENIKVELHPTNKHHLVASNVPDVDKLNFETDMAYKLLSDSMDKNKFHLQYDPQGGVHRLDVSYDGKAVRGGQFEFVPKEQAQRYEALKDMETKKREYHESIAAVKKLQLAAEPEPESNRHSEVCNSEKEERQEEAREEEIEERLTKESKQGKGSRVSEWDADTLATHRDDQESEGVPAENKHLMQAAPKASYAPMMVPQQMYAQQQQQQPMMMAAQPMMMPPMQYGMTPPMYPMVPQQQYMQQQQQARAMYQPQQ